jgi:hypothetical protein
MPTTPAFAVELFRYRGAAKDGSTLAMAEAGDAIRHALQGKSGADAIGALFKVIQSYMAEHLGRYNATTGAQSQGLENPLLAAPPD